MSSTWDKMNDELYDKLESLMAGQMGAMAHIYRMEVALKEAICKKFDVTLDFEYEYTDMKMIIPASMVGEHPIFTLLINYEWVYVTQHAEQIIVLNRKATEIGAK
tara:strand:+ start:1476 stop:1790 length:315 start_codon:yes stop_codon:yes gene_type:complete